MFKSRTWFLQNLKYLLKQNLEYEVNKNLKYDFFSTQRNAKKLKYWLPLLRWEIKNLEYDIFFTSRNVKNFRIWSFLLRREMSKYLKYDFFAIYKRQN